MQNLNRPQSYAIDRKQREEKNGHRSFLIWFTGLSGSGKSTIANLLDMQLHELNFHTYTLDGSNVEKTVQTRLYFVFHKFVK